MSHSPEHENVAKIMRIEEDGTDLIPADQSTQDTLLSACLEYERDIDRQRKRVDLAELKLQEWITQLTPDNQRAFFRQLRAARKLG